MSETSCAFACFGGECAVHLADGDAATLDGARTQLLAWHERFSRFDRRSELSRLNHDARTAIPVSPIMARFVDAAVEACRVSGGLVDVTLVGPLERAGYTAELGRPLPLAVALRLAPARRPATAGSGRNWQMISVEHGVVNRPPGVPLDSGGIAKGLFADLLAERLAPHGSYAIDCSGDVRIGGRRRIVNVASPFDDTVLHTFELTDAGVATSGIGRRSWLDANGRPAHHLLDPGTGRPAFTGIVQATAVASTALEAEVRSKAALLSGPEGANAWLPDGGVLVFDDASHTVIEPVGRAA